MIEDKVLQVYRRAKVSNLIKEVHALHGGVEDDFLHEYTQQVLQDCANDLQSAITCFEGLKAQALALGKRLPQPVQKQWEPSKGHPTFREHYERTRK